MTHREALLICEGNAISIIFRVIQMAVTWLWSLFNQSSKGGLFRQYKLFPYSLVTVLEMVAEEIFLYFSQSGRSL